MDYLQALDVLADDPHIWRYRQLVEDENARKRDAWRERVVRMAMKEPEPESKPASVQPYPSLAQQAMTAARAAAGFAASGFRVVSQEEQVQRLAVCKTCEHYDAGQGRCRQCGCNASLKSRLASSHCPIGKW